MENLKCIECGFILPGGKSLYKETELSQLSCPVCGNSIVESESYHNYIDLGLSVKWATCNMGASEPEETGNCYAWGEIKPKQKKTDNTFSVFKENRNTYGSKRHNVKQDVAHVCWNGKWRIPTKSEFQELINDCYWGWADQKGMNGYVITSKLPGYKQLFLPAAGEDFCGVGHSGCYWTNTLNNISGEHAKVLTFNKGGIWIGKKELSIGCSIRPVCE